MTLIEWFQSLLCSFVRQPPPPGSQGSDWEPKTPSNYMQLQKKSSSVKTLLHMRSRSLPSPLNTAINHILKACQVSMQSASIHEREISTLCASNEKQKQKQTHTRRLVPHEGGLSASEAHEQTEAPIEAPIAPAVPQPRQPSQPLQPRTWPPWWCEIYRAPAHRRETCPDRPRKAILLINWWFG